MPLSGTRWIGKIRIFTTQRKLDAEMRRVFDICHTCRRCFNLCDSFPRLFDLIDNSKTGELDGVASSDFRPVVDACTLCDMCFMTKCPYVPPHRFDLDFPHLMLRARAVAAKHGEVGFADRELAKTDRNGKLAALAAPLANWGSDVANRPVRHALERVAGLDHDGGAAQICVEKPRQSGKERPAADRSHRAGLRPQGGSLCDLLHQLQRSECRPRDAGGAGQERGRDRSRASALLRHAAARTGAHRRGRRKRQNRRRRARSNGSTRATTSSRSFPPAR